MASQRGFALISALLLLGFLALVGGALLTTATVDVRIGENYRTNMQLLLLAEAGLEQARELLRASPDALSADLAAAAGPDGALSDSRDWATLLTSTDDRPLLPSAPAERAAGHAFTDPTGRVLGRYWVFLRNDAAEGAVSTTDANAVVTLLSIARIGNRTRIMEADVRRGGWGALNAALTLNGPIDGFEAAESNIFHIDGRNPPSCVLPSPPADVHSIGVFDAGDVTRIVDEIPPTEIDNYPGVDPTLPDIENLADWLPGNMRTPLGLETLIERFAANATDVYNPPFGSATALGDIGSPSDPRIVVVNGDLRFGPGTGYGVLVVRGYFQGWESFTWNGLILVAGQGDFRWNTYAEGEVNGAVFVARTRSPGTGGNPLGNLLSTLGPVNVDFNTGGGNGIIYNACALHDAYRSLPYSPIAIREF